MTVMPASSARLAVADAFRALAIGAVVLTHLLTAADMHVAGRSLYGTALGVWGVNCFFVLSGLLLARPYLAVLVEPGRGPLPSPARFLERRALRIYPLYVCGIALGLAVTALTSHTIDPADAVAHLLMVHGLLVPYALGANAPLWTMAVDTEFYVLVPLCAALAAVALRGRSRRLRTRALVAALALAAACGLAYRAVAVAVDPRIPLDFATAVVEARNVVGMAPAFALGSALALADVCGRLQRPRAWLAPAALALGAIALVYLDQHGRWPYDRHWWQTSYDALAALSATLLIFGVRHLRLAGLHRVLQSRIVARTAALAYAVYVFHLPFATLATAFTHRLAPQAGPFARLGLIALATALLLLPAAIVAHRAVERPFLALKARRRELAAAA